MITKSPPSSQSPSPPPKKKHHKDTHTDKVKKTKNKKKQTDKDKDKSKDKPRATVPDTQFYVSTEIPECSKYLRRRETDHCDDDDDDDGNNNNNIITTITTNSSSSNSRQRLLGAPQVLDEDTYDATLSHIITRDFYPDLPELRTLTGEDPDSGSAGAEARALTGLSMAEFFRRYRSEDDHSYALLSEREDRRDAKRKRWLLATEAENQALRAEAAAHPERGLLIPWKYEKRNPLFYTPSGAPLTAEEREARGLVAPLSGSISLAATRFQERPSDGSGSPAQVTLKQPITRMDMLYGRIGLVNPSRLRKAEEDARAAAKFVATPSPRGMSPPVTWGKVVGAPVALRTMRTPVEATPGPLFSLPKVSKREEIGNRLGERAGRAMRERGALKRPGTGAGAGAGASGGEGGGEGIRRGLGSCSPAVQSIVERINRKRKGLAAEDSQLRAFYSPSPAAGLPKMLTKVKEEPKD